MNIFNYLIGITEDYWGGIAFSGLFVIGLIAILVLEKEKIKRYTFLWYSIVVLVFIYNPLTLLICKYILERR